MSCVGHSSDWKLRSKLHLHQERIDNSCGSHENHALKLRVFAVFLPPLPLLNAEDIRCRVDRCCSQLSAAIEDADALQAPVEIAEMLKKIRVHTELSSTAHLAVKLSKLTLSCAAVANAMMDDTESTILN